MIFEGDEPRPNPPLRTGCVVLVVLLGGLALLLVPAIQKVRDTANRSACLGRHKWMSLGLHNYASAQTPESFPAGTVPNADLPVTQRLSWYVELLPFTEEQRVYDRIDRSAGWDDPANAVATATPLHWAVCHHLRDAKLGPICYTVGVAGVGADADGLPVRHPRAGVFGHDRRTRLDPIGIPDGTSNTLLLIEDGRNPGLWAQGGEATVRGLDPTVGSFGMLHRHEDGWVRRPFVTLAAMADGSVRTFSPRTTPALLAALATVAGGESLPPD